MNVWEQIANWYYRNGFRDAEEHMEAIKKEHADCPDFLLTRLQEYAP